MIGSALRIVCVYGRALGSFGKRLTALRKSRRITPAGFRARGEEEGTPKTAAAIDRSRASIARGEGIPHEDILREFGLGK
jgi:hypothetical protein